MIGVEYRKTKRTAVDRSSIYQGDEFAARGTSDAGFCGQPRESVAGGGIGYIDRNQIVGQAASPDLGDAVAQVVAGRRLKHGAAVFQHPKGDVRVCHGEQARVISDVCGFRRVRFEELAAGGHGVKQVSDLNHRADRHATILLVDQLAAIDQDFGAVVPLLGACAQGEFRDRCNRRQRFAAKAEAADLVQIGRLANFAGGVALE